MKQLKLFKWFKNISIARKLYFVLGIMAFLIALELFTLWFSISTLSALRGYVGAEGLWSKAQKDAIYHLRKYVRSGDEADYREFHRFLEVPMGDRSTRIEMTKENPDYDVMRRGFMRGRIHPDDIDGMIKLFRRFHNISYIRKAAGIWAEGDSLLSDLQQSADELHSIIQVLGLSSPEKIEQNLMHIDRFNAKLTELEDEFSATLGDGSRWLEGLILGVLLSLALTVEVSGLVLTISVTRNISKGINDIIRASEQVAKGNFNTRATVYSNDEIGRLAVSFNKMTGDLEKNINELRQAEKMIRKNEEKLISKEKYIEYNQNRINELLEVLLKYTRMDFSQKIHIGEETDELAAIGAGLNTMSEELENHIKQLKEGEEQIRVIFKNAPDGVVVMNEEGVIVKWNPKAESIFGWTEEEVLGKNIYEIIIPENAKGTYLTELTEALKTREGSKLPRPVELLAARKDRSLVDVKISVSPTALNGVRFFIGFINDISYRKNAERELLRKSEELTRANKELKDAQRIAHIGSWEWDLTANTIYWSDELYRIHDMEPESTPMTLDRTEQWILPDDMDSIKKQLTLNFEEARKAFSKNIREYNTPQMNYGIISKDGKQKTLLGQGKIFMDEEGRAVKMTGTVQDITLIKKAEKELLRTNVKLEERVADRTKDLKQTIAQLEEEIKQRKRIEAEIKKLSFVISKTDNAVLIADRDGNIQWVNEGFVRLSGYSLEDVAGTHGEIVMRGKETGLSPQSLYFGKIKKEKQSVTYESHNYKKDGTEYWTVSTLTPILNEHGQVENIVVVDSDITSRKKAEAKMLEAKKIAEESAHAKELFLANMSHEIRTPMNAIMGIVQLMQDMDINDAQKKYLRSLQFAGENLLYIINDILDLTKIESGKMNIEKIDFNISALVDDLIDSMNYRANEKNIALVVDLQKDIPENLLGDPVRLNQILTNLISNAIKFTDKGRVTLVVKQKQRTNGSVVLLFEVLDTGIGIAKEKQELVFAAFEQAQMETSRKYGGTGLGLSIVKRLVELQGGKITVESEPGVGSKFSFELEFPILVKKIRRPEENGRLKAAPDLTDRTVLLVEDNALNQMVAEKFLEVMGVKVEVAENGIKAVEMLKKNEYDLILMDIQMPEMDGYETTHHIRNNFSGVKKNIPILAMTAHAFQGEEIKCRQAGMNDYIAKPLNRNVLLDKITQLLNPKPSIT